MRTKAQTEAAERDGRWCLYCLCRRGLLSEAVHVHHICHRHPGTDIADLCIHLCVECHEGYHSRAVPSRSEFVDLLDEIYCWRLREIYPQFLGGY